MPRLRNVLHESGKLYLVFEYLLMDLKKYMDTTNGPIDKQLIKVSENYFHLNSILDLGLPLQDL